MSRNTSSSAPSRAVAFGQLGRIALVDEVDEARALHDSAIGAEAGNDPATEHQDATPAGARPPARTSFTKFAQEAQAVVAAALGVELDAEQVAAGDRRHEPRTVLGLGQDDVVGCLRGRTRIRMDEVEVGPVADPVEEQVVAAPDDLVPTDVREGRGILEPPRPAGQHAERLRAVLVTRLEAVQPETHAEERLVRRSSR